MARTTITSSKKSSHKSMIVWIFALLVIAGVIFATFREKGGSGQMSNEDRAGQFAQARAIAAQDPSYPATPGDLITEFWQAASRGEYARLAILCPGAVEQDFKVHYEHFTPSPAKAIGHPAATADPAVKHYPVTVPFPGFPEKTVKMAVRQLPEGQFVIDGQLTIWW